MADLLLPCGWVFCREPRLARLLETELAFLGISGLLSPTLPPPSPDVCLLLADGDDFSPADCLALADACGCPLLLFGRESIDLPARSPRAAFLRRPFALNALEKTVRHLLAESSTAPTPGVLPDEALSPQPTPPPKRAAEPAITIRDGALTVDGLTVSLTPAERAIFEHLRARPHATVTREELSELLGGGGNIVDVYVCRLRAKIEKPLGRRMIRTVRGVGYVMDV